jgi:signal transduction histidine kinase
MYSAEMSSVEIEKPIRVLIVEDDPGDVKLVRLFLLEYVHRYEVEAVKCISDAIKVLHDGVFDVVLLDMGLPDSQGIDTVLKVHNECPDIPIVVLTGLNDEETGVHAVRIGAQDYLVKGDVTSNLLTRTIRYAIERKRMEVEKRRLEQKAQIASRLATVGQLAFGIAHEIDNPLTSVIGFTELLQQEDIPEYIENDVKIIHDGAQRVASIVNRLRTFARYYQLERTYLNINETVTATLDLLAHQLELSNIKVTTQLTPDLPMIIANDNQLKQVFLNIILNAQIEMKSAHKKGALLIKTEMIDNSIRIYFEDDGPGISKENLEKIFDPFFTTREVGEGAGLGLSVCYGIVTEHGGRIYAHSELGKGATFIVELPLVTETDQPEVVNPSDGGTYEQL